ncbi:MAG: acylneuraminate cytidylyltransferase family protein [Alphaproteobacteria bacterium]|nr:acylneuraminate cytidylyltransferase family protein [Alphaproteobacteria bacterium]
MINDLSVLAVVPARGGSKGVPLKNLRPVRNVPIVELAGRVAGQVDCIDRAIVSTDHEEIARAAVAGGLSDAIRRPEELSGDVISDVQVLTHALLAMEELDARQYDIVVMLQPTSPLRRPQHVVDTIEMLVSGQYDAVWTVSETDSKSHPFKQLTVEDGKLDLFDERGAQIIARQQLQPVYHRNGLAYAMTRECLLDQKTIAGEKTGALICEGFFVSIDTEWDFKLVDFILKSGVNAS